MIGQWPAHELRETLDLRDIGAHRLELARVTAWIELVHLPGIVAGGTLVSASVLSQSAAARSRDPAVPVPVTHAGQP